MSPTRGQRALPRRGALLEEIARSDGTFRERDGRWSGKCLICNGWLSFDPRRPAGISIEHIIPRTLGGSKALTNLALAHPSCNGEKGRNWDNRRGRRGRSEEYAQLVDRLQRERARRWRDPVESTGSSWVPADLRTEQARSCLAGTPIADRRPRQ